MKLAVLAFATVALSGCSPVDKGSDIKRLALPVAGSDRSQSMWNLWLGAWIAVLAIFLLVFGLMVFAMIRYRRRADDEVPPQIRYNLPIEALYTFAPVIIVAVFFFHTVTSQQDMLRHVKHPDHVVDVIGSKWQWAFDYKAEQATAAKDVFDVGTPSSPTELWLPVDESVRFNLKSPDVIHSFWVPEFYFKMDVIPGKVNTFDMTPTREGVFTGRCAELCGIYHSRMIFKVHVVSRAEYDAHLKKLQNAGQTGAPQGAKEADTIAGLDGQEKPGNVERVQGDGSGS
ncbi:MAG: cytochrome c oxidase subunit [Nocardioidaceae bacterium]|jgi:cytochrome c oxidase subunit 2|nr:cytochrome c oxidase subunit [Nocardioidaceae bacterium]